MNSRRKLLLLASASLIASTTALMGFSFAWFMSNRQRTVNLQAVQVEAPGFGITDYKVYGVTALTKGPTTTSITFVNEERLEMPRYDPQSIDFSIYKRAIVVHISFEYIGTLPITLEALTSNNTFTTGTLGTGLFDDNFTSNAFQITLSPGTTLSPSWTQASLSYTNADTKSFVTFTPAPNKTTALNLDTINPGDFETWLVLEYNEAAMMYINDDRSSNERVVIYHDDIVYRVS